MSTRQVGPIEWGSYGADFLEKVMGVLMLQDNPDLTRRTPASGDGGVDLMIPTNGGFHVKQVKGFTGRLNSSRKKQVENSLRSCIEDPRLPRGKVVETWRLVVPIDPTDKEQAWFDDLIKTAPFPCEWDGQGYWDLMAARHPHVIDYYMRDGAIRIAERADILLASQRSVSEPITALDVAGHLEALRNSLNQDDPHYRYEFETGKHAGGARQDGLVLTASRPMGDGDQLFIHVIAKHAYAVEERPITGTVKARVYDPGEGIDLRKEIDRFIKYGSAIHFPAGSVDIELDAPAGLGGVFSDAEASIGPAKLPSGHAVRFRARNPAEPSDSATLKMKILHTTTGQAGFESTLEDVHGNLHVVATFDAQGKTAGRFNINFKTRDVVGQPVADVIDLIRLLARFRRPYQFQILPEHGQKVLGTSEFPDAQAVVDEYALNFMENLQTLQEHVDEAVVVPSESSRASERQLELIATLLREETVEAGEATFDLAIPSDQTPEEFIRSLNEEGRIVSVHALSVDFPSASYGPKDVYMVGTEVTQIDDAPRHDGFVAVTLRNPCGPVTVTVNEPR